MSGSRGARLTGLNPPEQELRSSGLQGGGETAGPLGTQAAVPFDAGAVDKKPASSGSELNQVGSYPLPKEWTTATEELKAMKARQWFPHTLDFLAVAGRGSKKVKSPDDFLLKILEAPGPIQRLNFFSHGDGGIIAMSGVIDPKVPSCSLDDKWTSVSGERRIADPYAKFWGDEAEESTSPKTVDGRTFTLDEVWAKFTPDAEIWLYTCKSGGDPYLLQNIANTFRVTARGFSNAIVYCAPANFPGSRKHKVNMQTAQGKEDDACNDAVLDFRKLKPNLSRTPK